ncbi:MAG TPA: aminodeoxychorismate/anthranilate synthase component II [Acidobacteriaceae bacterium]|jgi:para-aminobenzoate synthetase|nr:aminodeoxychorismate/anthranilate synthase component II [Acidobacteriaceae bacterium]
MTVTIIDNYDSFTYNLYDLVFRVSGVRSVVVKNDELTFEEFTERTHDAVILSPGPGHPGRRQDFGISSDILIRFGKPILGICLGHQGIATSYGGKVVRAPIPVHGLTDRISHCGTGLFEGIPQGVRMVRYHSLIVADQLPGSLRKTAWNEAGLVMGLEHVDRAIFGVQFHPESICSEFGEVLMANFLRTARTYVQPACGKN